VAEYRLANGLKVLLLEDHAEPQITTNIVYLVGSRQEGYGEAGMAHLLEHMLFKGTPEHREIKKEITDRGAIWNGGTYYDRTNYHLRFESTRANLDWALELEADRMVNSFVSRADLDAEMSVVRNEFERGENSPVAVLGERVAHAAFEWHNYGRTVIGNRSDIEHVSIERLQDFYRTYYQPDNAVLVIAGDFSPADALALAAARFGAIPRPTRVLPHTYTRDAPQDGEREVTLRRKGDNRAFAVLYHAPAGTDPGYAAVDMLTLILGDTPTGRLHKALVETKLATSVGGYDHMLAENGAMEFTAAAPKDYPAAPLRAALLKTIEGLAADPIRPDEVERAKQRTLTRMDMTLTKTHQFALDLTESIALGDWRYFFRYRDYLSALTADDVNRAARTYLIESNRTLGEFIPAASTPARAAIPEAPDLQAALKDYAGPPGIDPGEPFDLSPANIEARTRRFTLSNGMQVAFLQKKSRGGMVSAQLAFQFGTEESKFGRATACGFAGGMLMRGTSDKTREQIRNEITRLRANLWVGGGGASIEVPNTTFEASLALVAEILTQPRFDPAEFDQLRRASIAGIESSRDNPGTLSDLALSRHINPYPRGHWAYTATLDEQLEDARKATLEDARRCYSDFYGLSNAQFSVVGDFDPDALKSVLEKLFGGWKSPQPYVRIPGRARPGPALDDAIETPDKANAFLRGQAVLDMRDDDPDYVPLYLANYLFGGSIDARLAKRIREKDGLSYNTGSSLSVSALDRLGQWRVAAIYAPQNKARVEQDFREELARARQEGFSAAEVARAKTTLMQLRKLNRASDMALAGKLNDDLYFNRTFAWDARFEQKLLACTPEEVSAAFAKYIDPAQISLVRAGDFR
jgi:zinc protease